MSLALQPRGRQTPAVVRAVRRCRVAPLRTLLFAAAVAGLLAACSRSEPGQRAGGPAPAARHQAPLSAIPPTQAPTFSKDVAPILYRQCASCHRPIDGAPRATSSDADPLCIGGAPFSVLEYRDVRRHAQSIAEAVSARAMPPWLPSGHGDFANERVLTDQEIDTIQRWVDSETPEGDPADLPAAPAFAAGWQLGKPDLVVTLPQPYTLAAGSGDVFRNFVLPVSVPATRYVRGVEFRADNSRMLHHANLAVDPSRYARALDRADRGPGFAAMADNEVQNVYGWSPGKMPVLEPKDTAWALEPGADLVIQLHMLAAAAPQTVQPAVGLFFSDTPPTRTPVVVALESKTIDIPAGAASYVVEDRYVLPVDAEAVSVYPHAHYLAREMKVTASLPDGTTRSLIHIAQWDVRWQDQYRYRTPVPLPRGTTLAMRFVYDNSAANPRNPHRPPQPVRWGPLSTEEMGAVWLEVVPRTTADAAVLSRDYFERAARVELAAAEMQVRVRPDEPTAHNLLAMRYLQAGRSSDARQQLETALRLDASDAEAHSNLGTVLQSQGQLAEALDHLQQAVRLKPRDDRMRFNLGNGLQAAGRTDEAIRELRTATAINDDNADAHFNLAMLLGPRNQLDEAIRHLTRVVAINPRRGDAYRNLALAYSLRGRLDEAVLNARAAVRLMPESAEARTQLATLLAARGQR